METAKDMYDRIVGQYRRKLAPMNYEDTIKFSQEIADKAWEAGVEHGFDPERYYSTEEARAAFMKSLFPENKDTSASG